MKTLLIKKISKRCFQFKNFLKYKKNNCKIKFLDLLNLMQLKNQKLIIYLIKRKILNHKTTKTIKFYLNKKLRLKKVKKNKIMFR